MAKLCIKLPPFSPDYSGVASALFDLRCLSILHDASGCTGNYTSYDEPRWYGAKSPVMCSGLREIDAVLGDDEKLVNNTVQAARDLNVELISIIGSPVPMVIGADTIGIAREIENETNIPTFGFETTGTRYYDYGIALALEELAKKFMRNKEKTIKPSINILGANMLDFSSFDELDSIKKIVSNLGFEIVSTMPLNLDFNSLKNSPSAWFNIVVTKSGFKLAKYMSEKFNQPYISYIPIGKNGKKIFENKLISLLNNQEVPIDAQLKKNPDILIIGEQIRSNAIRDSISKNDCCVNTLFGLVEELKNDGDINLFCESEIIEAVNSNNYKTIIADPLILDLIENPKIKKVPIPHYVVSSKLYKNKKLNLIGENFENFLEKIN